MIFSALSELAFPTRCLGCQQLGISICSQCRAQWNPHIYRLNYPDNLRVYSGIPYSPVAKRVILSAKEDGLLLAEELIVSSLTHVAQYFIKEVGEGVLLPIPSRRSAVRKRGREFIFDIATQIGKEVNLDTVNILLHNRRVRDQSRLSHRLRFENLDGAFSLNQKSLAKVGGRPVILIDDLVTTGATLQSAARALQREKVHLLGSITAAYAKAIR